MNFKLNKTEAKLRTAFNKILEAEKIIEKLDIKELKENNDFYSLYELRERIYKTIKRS